MIQCFTMRGKPAPKRQISGDPKFGSVDVQKFINIVMQRGKKSVAERIVYQAFELIADKTKQDPLKIFDKAINTVSPTVEIRPRRVGGSNFQIPFPVPEFRKKTLAYRWIIGGANAKKGRPMAEKLAQELIDASKGEGVAMKKKMDVHRMAEANKAYAHFAKFG